MNAIMRIVLCGLGWLATAGLVVAQEPKAEQDTPVVQPGEDYAWLGVELGPVPACLAAHLHLNGDTIAEGAVSRSDQRSHGLMITNLFKDSPAEHVGLQRYDVIVKADGEEVSGDVRAFTRHVRNKKPGDELLLNLIRGGKDLEVKVSLAARPSSWDKMALKYEEDPDVTHQRGFGLRGKILRRGADGRWELEDLGSLPWTDHQWKDSRPPSPDAWPRGREDRKTAQEQSEINEGFHVDADGRVVHVRRLPDGAFEVKRYLRTEGRNKAEVKTYRNARELREKDPRAYKLMYPSDWVEGLNEYAEELRESLPEFRKWYDEHKPSWRVPDQWREWEQQFFRGPLRHFAYPEHAGPPPTAPQDAEAQPDVRFEVNADGQVIVHVREPGTELNMTYPSIEEFQKQAPDLYTRFERMRQKIH